MDVDTEMEVIHNGPMPETPKSSEYSINKAPLRKRQENAQAADKESDARNIFKNTQNFTEIKGDIHKIVMSDPFVPADFKLLEMDKETLKEILDGEELVIRGQSSDFVVACTSNKTYQVKEVEASNSFLLFPKFKDLSNPESENDQTPQLETVSVTNIYLELMEAGPTYSVRLREILQKSILDLGDGPLELQRSGLTWDNLLDEIQMSEAQLRVELNRYPYIEHKGFIYLLSEYSQSKLLDELVELCDDPTRRNITVNRITFDVLKENFSTGVMGDNVILWILKNFCNTTDDPGAYLLSKEKVIRARARELLSADKSKEWSLTEFETKLEILLPNSFLLDVRYLKGLALLSDDLVLGKKVRYLNSEDLPTDIQQRLETLFKLQSMWTKDDIEPYVIDFCPNSAKIEEFLLRHCRIVRKGTEKVFCLKQF
ncbi:sister chromatid cohesion protein dcc1 domain-containing protein [Ditylenchus destructor]|uniref:Sister chromatid cohesion protein DCC1 n=1 Tax=Ditylenchus destructor TaxID=166010 RepID=A0AAD4NAL2_9BILA|nr:sister chromatid cohesion protein dcc1 domain-containing protein [Ditylenchus destructor]